jgi:hypothetical protein
VPHLNISAEDCIAVVDLVTSDLAPDPSLVGRLGETAANLAAWQVVWDFRAAKDVIYNDILDAYEEAAQFKEVAPTVLACPGYEEAVENLLRIKLGRDRKLQILGARDKGLVQRPLDLSPFADGWTGSAELIKPADFWGYGVDEEEAEALLRGDLSVAVELGIAEDEGEAEAVLHEILVDIGTSEGAFFRVEEEVEDERAALLDGFLQQIASNSLLAQVAFVAEAGRIHVVPMHANALHDLDCGNELLSVRPARRGAAHQWRRFSKAIDELEELINTPGVREAEIESILVRNPLFLRGLNYVECYHQVVLPLEGGHSLRPDVIVEPVAADWCDVVDLKLPSEPVFVGSGDRPRLSHAIAQAASQLRQYATWFDDRKVAKAVEDQYGFRCYRPRQVVIIGRDPRGYSDVQRDAARSAYPDLEIVTYDQILNAARSRLLF